ncbi:uncharacterized protein LOC144142121 isoform X2 [Haemaphysalis longicornis]
MASEEDESEAEDDVSTASTLSAPKKAAAGGGSSLCLCLCVVGVLGVCGAAAAVAFVLLGDSGAKNTTANATEEGSTAASAAAGGVSVLGPVPVGPNSTDSTALDEDAPRLDAFGRFANDDGAATTPEDTPAVKVAVVARQRLNRKTARVKSAKRMPRERTGLSHRSKTTKSPTDTNHASGIKQRKKATKNAPNRTTRSSARRLDSRTTRKGRAPPKLVTAKQQATNVTVPKKTSKNRRLSDDISNEKVLPRTTRKGSASPKLVLAKQQAANVSFSEKLLRNGSLPDDISNETFVENYYSQSLDFKPILANLTTNTTGREKGVGRNSEARKEGKTTEVAHLTANATVQQSAGSSDSTGSRLSPHGGGFSAGTVSKGPVDSPNLVVNETRRVDSSEVEHSEKDIVWKFQNEA